MSRNFDMWWIKKDNADEGQAHESVEPGHDRKNSSRAGRRANGTVVLSPGSLLKTRKTAPGLETSREDESKMNLSETTSGIEISIKGDHSRTSMNLADKSSENVPNCPPSAATLSSDHRRVRRAQFATRNWKPVTVNSEEESRTRKSDVTLEDFQPRSHRLPLFGHVHSNSLPGSSADDAGLLKKYEVADEFECIRDELDCLDNEITALMKDRDDVAKHSLSLSIPAEPTLKHDGNSMPPWDAYRKLKAGTLRQGEGQAWKDARGTAMTVFISGNETRQSALSLLGVNDPRGANEEDIFTFTSDVSQSIRATDIQHVSLFCNQSEGGILLCPDMMDSTCSKGLPERLANRFMGSNTHASPKVADLCYLATGPLGSYYAEFKTGECWWGSSGDDDLQILCEEWDIARIAFGPAFRWGDQENRRAELSWVVLATDGRTAWKNVPARLDGLLEGRMGNQAAPCEVALGYGGSFFIYFLDGTVDYCLPSHVTDTIRSRKMSVSSICLNASLPRDFIIRHK